MKAVHLKTGGEKIGQNKKSKASVKRLVLLDAHAIIHRAYHALPDFSTRAGEPTGGLYGVAAMLIKIINELKPDYIIACYDLPKPTFRHDAYEGYKSWACESGKTRSFRRLFVHAIYSPLLIFLYMKKEGFEADDILGTIVEKVRGYKDTWKLSSLPAIWIRFNLWMASARACTHCARGLLTLLFMMSRR